MPAELIRLLAISSKKQVPATAQDVTSMATITPIVPGLMEVSLNLSSPGLSQMDAFQFDVRHLVSGTYAYGSTMVADK